MKKIKLVVILAGLVALTAQAADMDWKAGELHDNGGPHDDGAGWALNGVDLYLVYNGINGSNAFNGIAFDLDTGELTIPVGSTSGTIVDTYTTSGDDYTVWGAFTKTMPVVGDLSWLGDTSDTWEDMNLREFTIVSISDADGDYSSGAMWNFYTGNPAGFSTAQGANSLGTLSAGNFDVSGAGALPVIPEPATIGLMGVAGLGMFLARRKVRR